MKIRLEKDTRIDGAVEFWIWSERSGYVFMTKDEGEARRVYEKAKSDALPSKEVVLECDV